jgi:hypothetical protein
MKLLLRAVYAVDGEDLSYQEAVLEVLMVPLEEA